MTGIATRLRTRQSRILTIAEVTTWLYQARGQSVAILLLLMELVDVGLRAITTITSIRSEPIRLSYYISI